jgi:hypothetical protein
MTDEFRVLSEVLSAIMHQRDKGFTLLHDLTHPDGIISCASATYALHGTPYQRDKGLMLWPWAENDFKPRHRRDNLIRAAALIVAEIVRLDAEHP